MNPEEPDTRFKGVHGEEAAVEYLENLGYEIVTRNFQTRHGEIDIVAREPGGSLVFVEVKTARDLRYGHPFFRVNRAKQHKLSIMARIYRERARDHGPCRFDAVAIVGGKVEHLKNAFLA